jgi:hypothetical protein
MENCNYKEKASSDRDKGVPASATWSSLFIGTPPRKGYRLLIAFGAKRGHGESMDKQSRAPQRWADSAARSAATSAVKNCAYQGIILLLVRRDDFDVPISGLGQSHPRNLRIEECDRQILVLQASSSGFFAVLWRKRYKHYVSRRRQRVTAALARNRRSHIARKRRSATSDQWDLFVDSVPRMLALRRGCIDHSRRQ